MDLLVPQPRPKESNREYACRVLRMNIMTFRLKPGEPLSEIEIAKLFQMSRTPVHEAITTLHNDWLIEIFPQRGTQVSRIDPALVKEGYSTRLLLESALLKDVAGKIGRSQVQELWDCMCRQESLRPRMPDAVDEFIHLDDEFHRLMYYFGGRSHTWLAIRGLVSHYDRLRYLDALDGTEPPPPPVEKPAIPGHLLRLSPEEIAGAVVFFASPLAKCVTGTALPVNAGHWMAPSA